MDLLDEVHADRAGDGAVGEGIRDVTPVVRQPSADIVVHAAAGSQHAVSPPSSLVFVRVRLGRDLALQRPLGRLGANIGVGGLVCHVVVVDSRKRLVLRKTALELLAIQSSQGEQPRAVLIPTYVLDRRLIAAKTHVGHDLMIRPPFSIAAPIHVCRHHLTCVERLAWWGPSRLCVPVRTCAPSGKSARAEENEKTAWLVRLGAR